MFPCYRFVAGVIGRERIPTFERMLWRVCRGNVFLRQADIEDPLEDPTSVSLIYIRYDQQSLKIRHFLKFYNKLSRELSNWLMLQQGDQVHKSVFIIFFQGDQLKNRVKKICEGSVTLVTVHHLYNVMKCSCPADPHLCFCIRLQVQSNFVPMSRNASGEERDASRGECTHWRPANGKYTWRGNAYTLMTL